MADALSRDRWADAALATLATRGLDAVRVEPLADRLGVTKGSFYWHFRDRKDLLEAMVERWERVSTQEIIARMEALTGSPAEKLKALFEAVLAARVMDLELALRAWARRDAGVARALRRVDRRRLAYNQRLFQELGLSTEEAEARAFLSYAMLFGDHFVAASDGEARRRAVLERCGALLLAAPRRRSRRPDTPPTS